MKNHSIFNDVLGPIMCGPSSSHSAGCARIGKMTQLLFGREVRRAEVVFDENGSYPDTYIGQGSDFGFTGGLLGYYTDNPRVKDAVTIAKQEGKQISFRNEDLGSHHPNEARIDVWNEDGEVELSVLTFSTGGGMFEIVRLNGFEVMIDGCRNQLFLCVEQEKTDAWMAWLQNQECKVTWEQRDKQTLFTIQSYHEALLQTLKDQNADEAIPTEGVLWLREAPAIMPVPMREKELDWNVDEKKEAWELALEYECSVGCLSREEVWKLAEHTMEVMERSSTPPDPETTKMYGFLPYQCQNMAGNAKKVRSVDTGVLNRAALCAIAVMENSCAHNLVVAAPTAGSSGVIPAAVVAVGKDMGCSQEELVKGLLAAGIVGAFIANQATFGAEVAGCQAENGAASAMAAAGVAQLLGGTTKQVFMAASLALQNMLGLVCDPVGGLTEIPCISRNVSAVTNAVMSANMVLWGFQPMIPLNETILAMLHVGTMLPAELRCTCKGGLCTTETGLCIARELEERRKNGQ